MKKAQFLAVAVASAALVSGAGSAIASTLYDNIPGFPNSSPLNSYCSSCGAGSYQVYEPFSLASSSTITHADFAIYTGFGIPSDLNISFWNSALDSDINGTQTISSGNYTTDMVTYAADNYWVVSVDLAPTSLAAGNYYVSFQNSLMAIAGFGSGNEPYVQTFGAGSSNPSANLDGYPQSEFGAFDLIGVTGSQGVPEPATWALMIGGFGLAGATLRRRRAVAA